jgi:hypothetical protein
MADRRSAPGPGAWSSIRWLIALIAFVVALALLFPAASAALRELVALTG